MIVTIISFGYIFLICLLLGIGVEKLYNHIFMIDKENADYVSVTLLVTQGIVALTVFVEFFSIFYKVGAICHIVVLAGVVLAAIACRREVINVLYFFKYNYLRKRNLLSFSLIILFAGFFASRGEYHTDTGIYHAQAIRILEEYGVVKGIGNLQLHFAYNSSYLVLCAFFTLSFILPYALHTVTGFFMVLYSCYALNGLLAWSKHKTHAGDMGRVGILLYSLTIMVRLQSPATDFGTQFFVMFIFCTWVDWFEKNANKPEKAKICVTGKLAVMCVFSVSLKLSASAMILFALYPLFLLVKNKMWKNICKYLLAGFLVILPFLIRNVIISGWLIYPFEALDLFNVKWKIPVEYIKKDATQIKVWARCLYDVTKADMSFNEWLPIWFDEKAHYEEMLLYSQFMAVVLFVYNTVRKALEKKLRFDMTVFYLTVFANIILWFITAPFIRYGLAFLLIFPLVTLGDGMQYFSEKTLVTVGLAITFLCINYCSWIDNYFTDNMVFIKHYLSSGYYFDPIPFEESEMIPVYLDGITVYTCYDEKNSYYYFPGSCYDDMISNTKPIGSTVKEGFMPIGN